MNIPTQKEYEEREIKMYFRQLEGVEKSSKQDRIYGFKSMLETVKNDPAIIAERITWILNGSYGFGAYIMSKRILKETKNPNYHLFHILAHLEYLTSDYYASKIYRSLSKQEQDNLNELVTQEIDEYITELDN